MPRSMWRGAIQFGLVTIPLRLFLATESKGVSFNMLHAECLTRVQMRTWCPVHERAVPRSETVKGYEYAPGQYVVVTDADLEAVPLKTVRAIEIDRFVPASDLAAMRFVKQAYYLEPEALGRKAFSLLRDVLAERGLVAICKVVITNREHLAALDPFGSTMLLSTLYWPDEIRSPAELDLPAEDAAQVRPAERAMADQLVAAMTESFDAAAYRDEYRDALLAIIEAKAAGQETVAPEAPAEGGTVIDLMAALEASVAAARAARTERPVAIEGTAVTAAGDAEAETIEGAAAAAERAASLAPVGETVEPAAARRRSKAAAATTAGAAGTAGARRRKTA
jgi:DNA end-binding protein Ku